jgi:hypothetical protein
MYFIVNITKPPREVTIADISFTLGPNKAIDLEKVRKRSEIEDSVDLKRAIKGKMIQVRSASRRDVADSAPITQIQNGGLEAADVEKIRAAVREEMQQSIAKQVAAAMAKQPAAAQAAIPPELLAAIQKLTNLAEQGAMARPAETAAPVAQESLDEGIDESRIVQLHANAVKRKMHKNTEGNIAYEQQSQKGSASDQADELGGLIDG